MKICGCGSPIEKARQLLNLKLCKTCAFSLPDELPVRGRMVYSHKTGGEIEIISAESFEANRKYFVPNGPRSSVKNFMRG